MSFVDDAFITLKEAAKLIPGADENTLKRMFRADKLTCYRPGKEYLTTEADVREAVKRKCRVVPKVRVYGGESQGEMPPDLLPTPALGLSSTELAKAALDSILMPASSKKATRSETT